MTPEQLIARKKKLGSAARALITGDLGLVAASIRIERALRALENHAPSGFEVFEEFYKAIPHAIPLGVARLQWQIELLIELDIQLTKIEANYRQQLLKKAAELVEIFG